MVHGIKTTAGVVTAAAIVMVFVFMTFATLSMVQLKEMGVGLAVAVLLDATIVRVLLLPATMKLLGPRNWYLPRWLGVAAADLSAGAAATGRAAPGAAGHGGQTEHEQIADHLANRLTGTTDAVALNVHATLVRCHDEGSRTPAAACCWLSASTPVIGSVSLESTRPTALAGVAFCSTSVQLSELMR